MELYWPQSKVYMFGQLALFSQAMVGKELHEEQLTHYVLPGLTLKQTLNSYKEDGYFSLEAVSPLENPAFILTDVDQQRLYDELLAYLDKYAKNELTTGTSVDPPRLDVQVGQIVLAVANLYKRYGDTPIVDLSRVSTPTFWELIFMHHFLVKELQLLNVGYDNSMPFAKFKVIAGKLQEAVKYAEQYIKGENQKIIDAAQLIEPSSPPLMARIGMDKEYVYAEIDDVRYLIKKVRVDSAPYKFMDYMIANRGRNIGREDIKGAIGKQSPGVNLTELVRGCGFTRELLPLKSLVFPGTNAITANFQRDIILTQELAKLLVNRQKME